MKPSLDRIGLLRPFCGWTNMNKLFCAYKVRDYRDLSNEKFGFEIARYYYNNPHDYFSAVKLATIGANIRRLYGKNK